MSDQPLLKVRNLSKFYGNRIGCNTVSFDLWPGEVLAIVGESGSGKTTLLNCLSTRLMPTTGSVDYHMRDGQYRELYHMSEAERRFLMRTDWGFVHQNPADGLRMTVSAGANVGERLMAIGDRHYGNIRQTATEWLERVEISTDRIDDQPRAFSGGMRQRLQIARNLVTEPRLVFMDEPTAVLSREETDVLFAQVRKLRAQGTSFVFVSHKLDEVMELTDRVTVLRDGQWVKTAPTAVLDGESIAQLMVGRELSSLYPTKHEPNVDEEVVLSVKDLSTGYVKHVSFELKKGEVLGFSGLIGSGRTELMEAVAGLRPRLSGVVQLKGADLLPEDFREANRRGLAYMTKDRKGKGLLLGEGMTANLTLQAIDQHIRHGYLDPSSEAKAMARAKRRFDIRVRDDRVRVGRMSGGNQQKLLLAKIMEIEPQIIIIDEPTRGIDVGTKQQIYHFIAALAREGRSIIVISSEMPEVIGLCTRVAVMREGRMVGILEGEEISEQVIMRYAAGLKRQLAS